MLADYHIWLPFVLLGVMFLALLREWAEPDVVAWCAAGAVIVTGLLPMSLALKSFSNAAPITVACMFILSTALEKTGFIAWLGHGLSRFTGSSEVSVLLVFCTFAATLSAFMNNTAVVAMLMPVAMSLSRTARISPSKLLIPMSFAAILGGTCTLIGTSTNLVVQGVLVAQKQPPIGMFEFSLLGLIYAVIGIGYLVTVGRKLLPDYGPAGRESTAAGEKLPLLTQFVVSPESALIGKTLVSTLLKKLPAVDVLEVRRRGVPLDERLDQLGIRAGDRLLITADDNSAASLASVTEAADTFGLETLETREYGFQEAVVDTNSDVPGRCIGDLRFRQDFAVRVLSVVRNGERITEKLGNLELESGDQLRLAGPTEGLERVVEHLQLLTVKSGRPSPPSLPRQARVAAGIFLAFVVASSLQNQIPTEGLALLAVIAVLVTKCLDNREAYESVSWHIIFLIIAMLIVGEMIEHTGSATRLAGLLGSFAHDLHPSLLVAAVYFLSMVLTELISNNAVAAMMTPIVLSLAAALGCDPRPLVVAVVFAASASFSTPVGYQTNTFIYGVGGYRFTDFFKVGIPLNLILWVAASFLIPWLWPLW
jgi:di/tricarboxylate transporter